MPLGKKLSTSLAFYLKSIVSEETAPKTTTSTGLGRERYSYGPRRTFPFFRLLVLFHFRLVRISHAIRF